MCIKQATERTSTFAPSDPDVNHSAQESKIAGYCNDMQPPLDGERIQASRLSLTTQVRQNLKRSVPSSLLLAAENRPTADCRKTLGCWPLISLIVSSSIFNCSVVRHFKRSADL